MMNIIDPLTFDSTKIRVPKITHYICDFHRAHPEITNRSLNCNCALTVGEEIVPAKMITEQCPVCHGSGTVERKVPLEDSNILHDNENT